jgi:16S rRNA processing protein RimM
LSEARVVGRVVKPHGIHGELVIEPRTDSPEIRFALGARLVAAYRDGRTVPFTVTAARSHTGRLLVRFEQVPDRNAAEDARGVLLSAGVEDLPEIDDPDEYYDHQLEGLAVVTTTGEAVGTLREVQHGAAGSDLLVVDKPDGAEALIPFVSAIVPEVDLAAGRVVVDPPEGLLD